jgi:hypothetical protein
MKEFFKIDKKEADLRSISASLKKACFKEPKTDFYSIPMDYLVHLIVDKCFVTIPKAKEYIHILETRKIIVTDKNNVYYTLPKLDTTFEEEANKILNNLK